MEPEEVEVAATELLKERVIPRGHSQCTGRPEPPLSSGQP
jgi:hypothetical protein